MKFTQSYKTTLRFTILICVFLPTFLHAQEPEPANRAGSEWGVDMHGGYLLRAGSDELQDFNYTNPLGVRISYIRQTLGHKPWQVLYNYPRIGFFLDYTDSGSPVLGKSLSAVSYLDFVSERTKSFEWGVKLGTGLCYAFNPYDAKKNPDNRFWGTHLNVVMYGSVYVRAKLNNQVFSELGLELNHASNGSFQKPNYGVNNMNAYLGLIYRPHAEQAKFRWISPALWSARLKYYAGFSFGVKEINPIGGRKYPFYIAYFSVGKRISTLSELNIGFDVLFDTSLIEEIRRDFTSNNSKIALPDYKQVGITMGHELLVGKLSLLTQLGFYAYKPYKAQPPIYQRYGLRYYFHDKVFTGITLKTHYARADVIEVGAGFRF